MQYTGRSQVADATGAHSFRGGATGALRDAVRDLRDSARAIDAAAAAYAGGALSDDASRRLGVPRP